jgi:coatomer subunit delta
MRRKYKKLLPGYVRSNKQFPLNNGITSLQNKEAEAKEELKRRAKQLEMQRREQQRRAGSAGSGPGSSSYLGGGISGYAPLPQRFDVPSSPARTASPVPSSLRAPTFKGSGMKLGSKKTKQAELLDALGGSALLSEDMSIPNSPAASTPEPSIIKDGRSSLPIVTPEEYVPLPMIGIDINQSTCVSVHIVTKENISLSLSREGGLESLELKGEMNLYVEEQSLSRIKISLVPTPSAFGPELQFKQHPNVGKFSANKERIIALKDPSRRFPISQSLAVLKWRYSGKDESYVPLSS